MSWPCAPRQGTLLTRALSSPRSRWIGLPGRTVKACVFELSFVPRKWQPDCIGSSGSWDGLWTNRSCDQGVIVWSRVNGASRYMPDYKPAPLSFVISQPSVSRDKAWGLIKLDNRLDARCSSLWQPGSKCLSVHSFCIKLFDDLFTLYPDCTTVLCIKCNLFGTSLPKFQVMALAFLSSALKVFPELILGE